MDPSETIQDDTGQTNKLKLSMPFMARGGHMTVCTTTSDADI